MGYRFASFEDREAVTGLIVDAAEECRCGSHLSNWHRARSSFVATMRRSCFRPKNSTVYSSNLLLEAEDRLLELSHDLTGPAVPLATIEKYTRKPDRENRVLGEDQVDALTRIAVSGRALDLLVGPAGAGKTTAMLALRRAWEDEHGKGSVVGLAPSAGAADVLAVDLGIQTENTAKWWQNHVTTGDGFSAGQLVILDEASLAGTLSLDRITGLAASAGAKVLLVGDYAQLQSVDAGGAFGLLAHSRVDVRTSLTCIASLTSGSKIASLDLRHGRTEAIDIYE